MSHDDSSVLKSFERAMIDVIPAKVRKVYSTSFINGRPFTLTFFVSGDLSEDENDDITSIIAEMQADFWNEVVYLKIVLPGQGSADELGKLLFSAE